MSPADVDREEGQVERRRLFSASSASTPCSMNHAQLEESRIQLPEARARITRLEEAVTS